MIQKGSKWFSEYHKCECKCVFAERLEKIVVSMNNIYGWILTEYRNLNNPRYPKNELSIKKGELKISFKGAGSFNVKNVARLLIKSGYESEIQEWAEYKTLKVEFYLEYLDKKVEKVEKYFYDNPPIGSAWNIYAKNKGWTDVIFLGKQKQNDYYNRYLFIGDDGEVIEESEQAAFNEGKSSFYFNPKNLVNANSVFLESEADELLSEWRENEQIKLEASILAEKQAKEKALAEAEALAKKLEQDKYAQLVVDSQWYDLNSYYGKIQIVEEDRVFFSSWKYSRWYQKEMFLETARFCEV
jgi:hypothetical protein